MTKLKKFLLVMTLGAGMGASYSAMALPGCDTCNDWYTECQAGDTARCTQFHNLRCEYFSGQECAIY